MNKKAKIITLITVFVIIVIALIFFMVSVISNKNLNLGRFMISQDISTNLVYDEIYEKEFTKININSDIADIQIKQSDDETFKVVIYSDEKDNDITVNSDSNLNINLKNKVKFTFFEMNDTNSQIIVYVPINYDKSIEIVNSYGDLKIDELANSNFNINSDCGDIEIGEARKVEVKNSYGDTIIHKANTISIEADCGDVEVGSVKTIQVENSYGDIEIKNISEYMDIVANCGDIEIDNVLLLKDSKIKNDFGDVSIKSIKDVYVDAKVDLGEISIKNNARTASITLTIENDCGDVEVN